MAAAQRRVQKAARRAENPVASLPDERLVEHVLSGSGSDFEILVRRHQGAIYNFLLRMVHDPDEALDLSQEVFLKVFCSLDRFDPRFRFTTWMYRIASNAAIDQIRKRRPGLTLSLDAPMSADASGPREVAGSSPTPDEVLQARETKDHLEGALLSLPQEYREVLLLRHQGERRYDEIARITGLPIGTVKNRIFRAREMLKRAIPS
ncbi:MAG TPA: sigma-70 family RNA polymerase sigma factor [Candidatus Polarisedimenticolia bacterium]|nr:sigma-70 family RNA polymerase sigma factor [Candidatus Polarisedimenticolia bacterium]